MKKLLVFFLFFQMALAPAIAQQYKYHIVKRGETVESVAQKYNTTKEIIYQLNPDALNGIRPQSKLVVPLGTVKQDATEFIEHKVKKGETIWRLSQNYNVSEEAIKRYNKHLYSAELRRGETVRIPIFSSKPLPVIAKPEKKKTSPVNPFGITKREHVVLPEETKFSISQLYNISVEELNRLNPGVGNIIKPGMILQVSSPLTEKNKEEKLFQYYLVKPKETLYSLTQRFGISKDSLIVLNPALADGLKSGMVLKIPNLETIGDIETYSEEDIINLENHISNYSTKDLVLMLPFNLQKIEVSDTTTNSAEQLRKDKVMQISLDFYSGVLMAVDSARTLGLSTNLRIYDTEQSSGKVNAIIATENFKDVDAVIGPLMQSVAETVAAGLSRQDIPVISPLTKKETNFLDNFYQTRPSDEMLRNAMLKFLSENGVGKNIVIIADAGSGTIKRQLLQLFPTARIVNPREGSYVNQAELTSALAPGRKNWVILESDKINIISNATSYLNSLADKFDITLLTTNKNNSFESDNVSNLHLSKLNFHFPSVDKEFDKYKENSFVAQYKKKYGVTPNTYAVRGFDVTYDIILRLASAGSLTESMEKPGTTEYVENKFDYQKKPSGGYKNMAIYIMEYEDNLELKDVNNDLESNLFRRFKD